jgi:6-phosphogluconolactonase (cycloisomerase 2 family)
MEMKRIIGSMLGLVTALTLAACSERADPVAPDADLELASGQSGRDVAGAVYTSTNAGGANEVLVFARRANGRLGAPSAVATGGQGSGTGLGSQGAVTLSDGDRWLLVVNAGSNDLSVFSVGISGISLTDRVASGGEFPVSVTVHNDLVYVLNAGGVSNVTGFRLSQSGTLTPLPGSTRPLSQDATAPAQVEFTPLGDVLVVTEKETSTITTFVVGPDGALTDPKFFVDAPGTVPFGFAFNNKGDLFVSEAAGGPGGTSALSSYEVSGNGDLAPISNSVASPNQLAACWVVITNNGRLAFVTNTASGTASSYAVGPQGNLSLVRAVAASPGDGPIDMALSRNGRFAYILAPGNGTVETYAVGHDGGLTDLGPASGVPASAYGLAAR